MQNKIGIPGTLEIKSLQSLHFVVFAFFEIFTVKANGDEKCNNG